MVSTVPTVAEAGDMPVMLGANVTLNITLLLATPLSVTRRGPVVAPLGTGTMI
jgi:hypothetical protein